MCFHHGTRQRVLECRRRVRRTRAVQRGATAPTDAMLERESHAWREIVRGGAPLKASVDAPMSDEESATTEGASAIVAEVDHFRSLRAR